MMNCTGDMVESASTLLRIGGVLLGVIGVLLALMTAHFILGAW